MPGPTAQGQEGGKPLAKPARPPLAVRLLAPLLAVAIGLGLLGPSRVAQASPWTSQAPQLTRINSAALAALAWPRPRNGSRSSSAPSAPATTGAGLQEVAPPGAVLLTNLVVDLLYFALDPRLRRAAVAS